MFLDFTFVFTFDTGCNTDKSFFLCVGRRLVVIREQVLYANVNWVSQMIPDTSLSSLL